MTGILAAVLLLLALSSLLAGEWLWMLACLGGLGVLAAAVRR